ncbi:helix-turn-helix transcriptional regulator [Porphyromonadaceae bacterium]
MKGRIEQIMKEFSLSATEFSERVGISLSVLSHIMSGRNNPSLDVVGKILRSFEEIDSDWLILGKGKMFRSLPSHPIDESDLEDNEKLLKKPLAKIIEPTLFEDIEESISPLATKLQKNIQVPVDTVPPKDLNSASPVESIETHSSSINKNESSPDALRHVDRVVMNDRNDKKIIRITIFYSDNTYQNFIME